jgi:hypothetical protein
VGVNDTAVRGKIGALDPLAVRVVLEIVTRLDRAVHVGDNDAVGRWRGRVLQINGKRGEG